MIYECPKRAHFLVGVFAAGEGSGLQTVENLMRQEGIDQWGICAFEEVLPLLNVRSKNRIPQQARSVIVMLFGYFIGDYTERNISRYAIVDDYHVVIRKKLDNLAKKLGNLYNQHEFLPFVDSSPVAEVRAAQLAGLGEIGLNGQLLNRVYGCYCFIGEIVTTLELPKAEEFSTGICIKCGKCLAACPTGALSIEGFQKERCRSHITQKKGNLTDWEKEQIRQGGFVWGCDQCTDACPVNRHAKRTTIAEFYEDIQPIVGRENAGRLCGTKAYGWRGENVLLRNLDIISGENMV